MKAQRRHELRDNDLLHALHVTRDYLNENGGRLGLALVVVIVVAVALSLGVRSRSAASEDAWLRRSMLEFSDVENGRKSLAELATLADQSNDEAFVLSALLEQGREALRLCQEVPFPPDEDLNEIARDAFLKLGERFPGNALAIGASRIGLATVEENAFAFDRDPEHKDRTRQYLLEVRDNRSLTGLPFPGEAIRRLGRLEEVFTPVQTVTPEYVPEPLEEGTGLDPSVEDQLDDDMP